MTLVWPHFQQVIFGLGGLVDATGYVGTFIYGFVLRMLGPFGLIFSTSAFLDDNSRWR